MNAMILAAGRGERLRPYTDTCPKPLLEVRGKPLIEYHLRALAAAGIDRVVINLSWLCDLIKEKLGDGNQYGLKICYSEEPEALETAGGIVRALPFLDEQFVVINGDVFTDYPFEQLLKVDSPAHIVLVNNPAHNPDGDFALDDGLVSNALEGRHTFAGIAVYQKSFFAGIEEGKQALAPLLRQAADNKQLGGELYAGEWTDVGTVERWRSLG